MVKKAWLIAPNDNWIWDPGMAKTEDLKPKMSAPDSEDAATPATIDEGL
jgi:hypothetical protein